MTGPLTARMSAALKLLEELEGVLEETPHAPRRTKTRRQRRALASVSRSLGALTRRGLVEAGDGPGAPPRLTLAGRAALLELRSARATR